VKVAFCQGQDGSEYTTVMITHVNQTVFLQSNHNETS